MKFKAIFCIALLACSTSALAEEIICPSEAELEKHMFLSYVGQNEVDHHPDFIVRMQVAGHDADGLARLQTTTMPYNDISIKLDSGKPSVFINQSTLNQSTLNPNRALLTCRYKVMNSKPAFFTSEGFSDPNYNININEPYLNLLISIDNTKCYLSGSDRVTCLKAN